MGDLQTKGDVEVRDSFTGGELLARQNGNGTALTFTFSEAVQLVLVHISTLDGSIDPFGGTPSASAGIPVASDSLTYIPVPPTTTVKVYAPTTSVVTVAGFRY